MQKSFEVQHPYLVTLPDGERLRFSNWPAAIDTACDRLRSNSSQKATIEFEGRAITATNDLRRLTEFPGPHLISV